MQTDYVAPVNHGVLSATGNVAAGTVGGALKTGLGAAALWIGALTVLGVAVGVTVATGGLSAILGSAAAGTAAGTGLIGFVTSPLTWGVLLGGLGGAAVGVGTSWLPGGIGVIAGGVKGASKASGQVHSERMAAMQMQAEIDLAKTQSDAVAPTPARTAPNYNFPEQGTPMNPAVPKLLAANDNAYADEMARRQVMGSVAQLQQAQTK